MSKQMLGPHAAYWKKLASDGRAIGAGPFRDVDGGMAIFSASNKDEAQAIVASDPAVIGAVFTATFHEWSPLIRGTGDLPR
ncbi:MAG: YciI family protein [Rudaea sp.]